VLHTPGTDLLSGLTAEEFVVVRSLVIEMVQHTDLSKHFDFITRLKTLADSKGHAAHAAAVQKQQERHQKPSGASFRKHAEGAHEGAASIDGPRKSMERRRTITFTASTKMASSKLEEESNLRRLSGTAEQAKRSSFEPGKRRRSMAMSNLFGSEPEEPAPPPPPPPWKSPYLSEDVDVRLVVATALKFADLGHSFKPFHLHEQWTARITEEFWLLGDREKSIGVPTSPLCDRERDRNIAQSQMGFFQFICSPFLKVVADLLEPEMEPQAQLQANFKQWQIRREIDVKESLKRSGDEAGGSASPRVAITASADIKPSDAPHALSPPCDASPLALPGSLVTPSGSRRCAADAPRTSGPKLSMATEQQPGPEWVVSLE